MIEDTYTVDDAVVVGSLLVTLLRHADRVKIACLAQLVNVIGALFVVNRSETDKVDLEVPLHSFGPLELIEHLGLYDDDWVAVNTADDPDRVVPTPVDGTGISNGICTAALPPASWHLIRLALGGKR